MNIYYSCIFWISILLLGLFLCPKFRLNKISLNEATAKDRLVGIAIVAFTILVAIVPMNLSPLFNGELPTQKEQYERQAEAFKAGHLYLDYEVDDVLRNMENPYDPQARDDAGADFHYDTTYYKGRYYMYFGVTPVILVYLPYLLITGKSLVGYKGTQIIVTALIIGIFLLFKKLSQLFFKEITYGNYLLLSVAVCAMTVWYTVAAPSLYTVPGTCGICMEEYSFYFFLKAVFEEHSENKSIGFAILGALFGALAFGCRPTVALANLFAIPLLVEYLRRRGITVKLILKLILVVLPYAIIGGLLMVYNYLRFENPFEFGQSYQLTTMDQTQYMDMGSRINLHDEIHGLIDYFVLSSRQITWLELGTFVSFPLLLVIVYGAFNKKVWKQMKQQHLVFSVIMLCIIPIVIASMDILWSPYFWPRYRTDIYWILGIIAFLVIGLLFNSGYNKTKLVVVMSVLAVVSIVVSFCMCLYPFDHNFTDYYGLSVRDVIIDLITFRIG